MRSIDLNIAKLMLLLLWISNLSRKSVKSNKPTRNYRSNSLNQLPTNPSHSNPFLSITQRQSKFPFSFSFSLMPLLIFLVLGTFLWQGLNVHSEEIPLAVIDTPPQTLKMNNLDIQSKNATDIYLFKEPQQQQLFNKITQELRCSVCQNQSLMDSAAPFAANLRQEIFQQIQNGRTEQEILDFVANRYGEFVLYRPSIQWGTAVLWFGPFLILILGVFVFKKFFRIKKNGQ